MSSLCDPVGIGGSEICANADTLITAISVSKKTLCQTGGVT
jgi:hypothetical protein